ncbi:23S rRNA (uracil747-C5)-methyltransferase [Diaminobutyricimonas aerilata]|uniref:23S rRNA (Uracil747-C5)-methyltransferase n=1 Tax=Diaminobutyricimonas aerilata TaxID=1162967 RepID=A0A2M9CG25_9MICO|nr:23S rRNA (uracil(747)-C(5))-methyltransferase RlmC [Diaminobutyricimonas aerilata]PJJ70884.1 23S rRNA (uracil747-C5)-methyltransferase [Diaminobutyricimonas aerilata]
MQCSYFDAGLCRSCTLLEQPYEQQLAGKEARVRELLAPHPGIQWLPTVPSAEGGFRNKAKMMVGGTIAAPTLGLLDGRGRGIDLRGCAVCTPGIRAALPAVASFITAAGLEPYDVPTRRGQLKNVILTESPAGELMVRFVVRTADVLPAIRAQLPSLLAAEPRATVVSVNLHPEHKAVVEGDTEVVLTENDTLTMRLGTVDLRLRPQSFFQTNSAVAAALYAQAVEWTDALQPRSVWDLYCGVGGFALHCAAPGRRVLGIETSAEAIESARASATAAAATDVRFEVGDATGFALAADEHPDLVIVNPPRRGIGTELAGWIERSEVRHVIYSSCNAVTLAKDLAAMPSWRPVRARVLDMFPHTEHFEVITLLERV